MNIQNVQEFHKLKKLNGELNREWRRLFLWNSIMVTIFVIFGIFSLGNENYIGLTIDIVMSVLLTGSLYLLLCKRKELNRLTDIEKEIDETMKQITESN